MTESATENSKPKTAVPAHRRHGIPDDIIEILGEPPTASKFGAEIFYQFVAGFAKDHPPASLADWCDLWDLAAARCDVRLLRRAKLVLRPLMRGRAIKEITRPGGLRFVPVNPYRADHPLLGSPPSAVEDLEPEPDAEAAKAELERLGLTAGQIEDLAHILALEMAAPLEALDQAKLNQVRLTLQELDRRRSARQRRANPGAGAQEAEFVEAPPSENAAP